MPVAACPAWLGLGLGLGLGLELELGVWLGLGLGGEGRDLEYVAAAEKRRLEGG